MLLSFKYKTLEGAHKRASSENILRESWEKDRISYRTVRFLDFKRDEGAAAMYLDDEGHVQWAPLGAYKDGAECAKWLETYGEGVPEAQQKVVRAWVAAKVAYDANRKKGDDLTVGIKEAAQAFAKAS